MKDENGYLLTDSDNILNNYFSELLNIQRDVDVRHVEIHMTELLLHDAGPFEIEIVGDQILAKLI
jgi:hypothetical protein